MDNDKPFGWLAFIMIVTSWWKIIRNLLTLYHTLFDEEINRL